MKSLPVRIQRLGNSLGFVIPKSVLAQVGISDLAELTVERGAIVLRKPSKVARSGWAEAAHSVALQGRDELFMGEFANAADRELEW
jgi:antitoxin MazE